VEDWWAINVPCKNLPTTSGEEDKEMNIGGKEQMEADVSRLIADP